MKRAIVWTVMLTLLVCLASPVFAAEFVPSITDKNSPDIVPEEGNAGAIVDPNGDIIDYIPEGQLIITPVSQVDTSKDIPEEAREQLKELYEDLLSGDSVLPYPDGIDPEDMVIRDLFDVSIKGELDLGDNGLQVTFDLDVDGKTEVYGFAFVNGEWMILDNMVNNGDGTMTVILPGVCQVAFAVEADTTTTPDATGDTANIALWVALMAVSAAALVTVIVSRRKIAG